MIDADGDRDLHLEVEGAGDAVVVQHRLAALLLRDVGDRTAHRVHHVVAEEPPDDGAAEQGQGGAEEAFAKLDEVLAERHPSFAVLASLGRRPPDYGFGLDSVEGSTGAGGTGAGQREPATGAGAVRGRDGVLPCAVGRPASLPSFFSSSTSPLKIRIDWPMLLASPGSFGAPKSSRITARMMSRCHPVSPAEHEIRSFSKGGRSGREPLPGPHRPVVYRA